MVGWWRMKGSSGWSTKGKQPLEGRAAACRKAIPGPSLSCSFIPSFEERWLSALVPGTVLVPGWGSEKHTVPSGPERGWPVTLPGSWEQGSESATVTGMTSQKELCSFAEGWVRPLPGIRPCPRALAVLQACGMSVLQLIRLVQVYRTSLCHLSTEVFLTTRFLSQPASA